MHVCPPAGRYSAALPAAFAYLHLPGRAQASGKGHPVHQWQKCRGGRWLAAHLLKISKKLFVKVMTNLLAEIREPLGA